MRLIDYFLIALVAIAFILALIYCIKNPASGCKTCEKYGNCPFKKGKCPIKEKKNDK